MSGNDDLARRIMARLDAIERHIGMDCGPSQGQSGTRDRMGPVRQDQFGPRTWGGGYDGPSDNRRNGRSSGQARGGEYTNCECQFDEKRTVDKIVELVTERLEEMLRVLPQLIQIEARPTRESSEKSESQRARPPS